MKSPITAGMLSWDSTEWYTPAEYVEAARKVMGGFDVDPASCDLANRTVQAVTYYTKETNGFDKLWRGRVWLNPPYGYDGRCNQSKWSARLIEQYQAGITTEAVLLVNAAAGTKWFDTLLEYTVCIPSKRINFYTPVPHKHGPTHGSALVYFGSSVEKFAQVFQQFGRVVKSVNVSTTPTLWEVPA